jgi:HlyD family secretion protein
LASTAGLRRFGIGLGVFAALAVVGWLAVNRANSGPAAGTLFGNVEIRQVDLAFSVPGRLQTMARREGDPVHRGDVVAALDPASYQHGLELMTARREAAAAQLALLLAGTRPETLDRLRAGVASAQALLTNGQVTFDRAQELVRTAATSRATFDAARMELDSAQAGLAQARASLAEAVAGPRAEDIAAARANLRAAEAAQQLAATQLANTVLQAPADGLVVTRVVEPGSVVLPGSAVYSMAVGGEVWVRSFAPEPLLGRVAPGTEVRIASDGGDTWHGRIGYVAPMAEFTPKTVETSELRSQLVYRLRIRVENPDDKLRQGMPVTITLPAVTAARPAG